MRSSRSAFALVVVAHVFSLDTASAFQTISPWATSPATLTETPSSVNARQSCTRLYSSVAITGFLSALDTFWQASPYTAAAITCGIKASAADLIAQKRAYRKREEKERKAAEKAAAEQQEALESSSQTDDNTPMIYNPNATDGEGNGAAASKSSNKADWKRNAAFLVYGSLYQGATQEFVYNHVYPVWFGTATTVSVVLTKVLFDLLVQTTLVTLPIAYLTKSVIYRYSFKEAMRRYVDDIKNHGLLKKYFLLWGPVQCMTFSIIPEHWRVTFIAFVSFFWLIILSTIASKTATKKVVDDETVAIDECSFEDGNTCNIDG